MIDIVGDNNLLPNGKYLYHLHEMADRSYWPCNERDGSRSYQGAELKKGIPLRQQSKLIRWHRE